ncbi:MAG: SPOR domain-containing protein [Chitinispirillales bacterium]|nr:SPOR domain-containing protein [Chitinispirillales bacterium]
MATRKFLITAAGIAAVALSSGCAKKDVPEDLEFASAAKNTPAASKKGTADIFDEFYMVDEDKKEMGKNATPVAATRPRNDQTSPSAPAARPQTTLPRSGDSQNFVKGGLYVVQVNTTSLRSGAERLADELKKMGYPAYVAEVKNPTPALIGTYFRVRIGSFNGYSDAKAFGENTLKPAGYDYWVDRKSNDNVGIDGSGFGSGAPAQYRQEPAPARAAPAPAPAATPRAAPAPQAAPTTTPTPVPQAAPVSTPAPTPQAVPTPAPVPQAAPAPVPAPQASPTPASAPQAAPAPAPQAAPTPAPVPKAAPAETPKAEPVKDAKTGKDDSKSTKDTKKDSKANTNKKDSKNNKDAKNAKDAKAVQAAPAQAPAATPTATPAPTQAAPAPAPTTAPEPAAQPETSVDSDWDDWEPGDWGTDDW